jgi:hypothetical protein
MHGKSLLDRHRASGCPDGCEDRFTQLSTYLLYQVFVMNLFDGVHVHFDIQTLLSRPQKVCGSAPVSFCCGNAG